MKLTLEPHLFEPLTLSVDDLLPVRMRFVIGYNYQVDISQLQAAIRDTLKVFPHLTGKLDLNLNKFSARVVPCEREIPLSMSSSISWSLHQLNRYPKKKLDKLFLPLNQAMSLLEALNLPFIEFKVSYNKSEMVIGLVISHMVLDGSGVGLFMTTLSSMLNPTASNSVKINSELIHDRRICYPLSPSHFSREKLPCNYRVVDDLINVYSQYLESSDDKSEEAQVGVFSFSIHQIAKTRSFESLSDLRLFLLSEISEIIRNVDPSIDTLSIWCSTRGITHVPRLYTGNTGCYVDYSFQAGGAYKQLKSLVSKKGIRQIRETYHEIKSAEMHGKIVAWDNAHGNKLSINIVPRLAAVADLGEGDPLFAEILTRNVNGIRMFHSQDGRQIIVELSLAAAIISAVEGGLANKMIEYDKWHQGNYV